MSNSNNILLVQDPAGNVVPVKKHSLKKGADGLPVLKPGWKLHVPAPAAPKK